MTQVNTNGIHLLNLDKAPSAELVFAAANRFIGAVEGGAVEDPKSKAVVTMDGHKFQCYYNSTGLTVKYSGALAPQNMLDLSGAGGKAEAAEEDWED